MKVVLGGGEGRERERERDRERRMEEEVEAMWGGSQDVEVDDEGKDEVSNGLDEWVKVRLSKHCGFVDRVIYRQVRAQRRGIAMMR